MNAEDIMTREPLTVEETTSAADALDVLSESQIRHLPVVRNGELIGMLSDRDLRELGVALARDVESFEALRARLGTKVHEIMNHNIVSVESGAPVSEVVDLLLEERIGAVPVVEPGTMHLVGIVSYVDVLRVARDQLD